MADANGAHANGHASAPRRRRVLILGAAGRDYHTFNTSFRDDPSAEVVGFTHAQIPHIESSRYPAALAGPLYPDGLPIWPEDQLERIVRDEAVDQAVLAYSDIRGSDALALAARARAAGASFVLLGARDGMLRSSRPVVAVTAVRTGCGKSQVCRLVVDAARAAGRRVVLVRHPMPYGDLEAQAVQRFETLEDLDRHNTTIEEREEYEQHIRNGVVVYAGVDYGAILRRAEAEADVVLWDGGNNDTPFFQPDLWICVADPFRPDHCASYHPGDANFRCADLILVNKANTAPQAGVQAVLDHAAELNPAAEVVVAASEVTADRPELVRGARVLCVEDGPTTTHGGMATGAAAVAAAQCGAAEVVDPRPLFVGELRETLRKYPHLGKCVPAMGYSEQQVRDLEATIAAVDCDVVVSGTPHDLSALLRVARPLVTASYRVVERPDLWPAPRPGEAAAPARGKGLAARLRAFMEDRVGAAA